MSYAEQLLSEDFVWTSLMENLAGVKKKVRRGIININCPMCVFRGETPDKRFRLGFKQNHPGFEFNCFNCAVKGRYLPGDLLSGTVKFLFRCLGEADTEISRLAHKAFVINSLIEANPEAAPLLPSMSLTQFPSKQLPEGSRSFSDLARDEVHDPDFIDVLSYTFSRGEDVSTSTEFFWTPSTEYQLNRRVIIPFYHGSSIVGYTARAIDEVDQRKYHSDVPSDFIFNNRVMYTRDRKYIIVVEGPVDALAIDGVAVMGAKMSDRKANWIDSMGKQVILVPDRDGAGDRLIDTALKRKWSVAFPALSSGQSNWWEDSYVEDGKKIMIKDVAAAVRRYGRLYTLCSILATATDNEVNIAVRRSLLPM